MSSWRFPGVDCLGARSDFQRTGCVVPYAGNGLFGARAIFSVSVLYRRTVPSIGSPCGDSR